MEGVEYRTAEQYMMAQKALLFGDKAVYKEIMAASHPKQYKALGQKVSGFVQSVWDENCCDIGMAADDKNCENPILWNGKNLLGFCLMEVRDILREGNVIK